VKSKFKRRHRTELRGGHILQLQSGQDFFRDAFGDDVDAMRSAWADRAIRERVRARPQYESFGVAFAEIAFGPEGEGGMVVLDSDVPAARWEYIRQRDTNLRAV